jgi:ABC-type Fe3+ transport system substrate-binding protein
MLAYARGLSTKGRKTYQRRERVLAIEHRNTETAMRNVRNVWNVGTALCAAVAAFCCISASAETTDELYAKAKAEKTLVLWGGGPASNYERAARAFEQQYPGITISVEGGASNVFNRKIEEQIKANKVETDLIILQTVQDLVNWSKRGLLLRFKPESFDKIVASSKDKDGSWIATNSIPFFYVYNPDRVRPEDVPRSALDFLKPQFKGKLITAYPSDDDAALYAFYTIVKKYGWRYMDRYMSQQPKFVRGHLGVARGVASGEYLASFDSSMTAVVAAQRAGGKLALAAPIYDAMPTFFTAEAILKDAPHPNAAKLFVNWLLSKDWQSQIGVYSSRNDVSAPAGLKALSSYHLADRYMQFVTNEDQLVQLRKRFEKYTGPVPQDSGLIVR